MATNYPSSLDALTNPTAGDSLTSPSHAAQHANVNDAVEAVQAELGTLPKGSAASVKARLEGVENGSRLTLTSLLTTKGDLLARDGSGAVRLPVGTDGQVLVADAAASAGVKWSPSPIASNGAVHLSGTGAPEGQVAAPVGSTYMQTDSVVDKRGVLTWLKVSGTSTTGWEPDANFDTGSLDVLHLKHASAAVTLTVSRMKLRRKGSLITFDVSWIDAQTNPHRQPLMVIPSGFRPAAGGYFAVPYDSSTSVIRNVRVGVSLIEYGGPTQASLFHATLTWDTYDPPPAAKP